MYTSNMNYPTLYKLTQTAATQMWRIHTENNQIITEFGHLEGKIQTTVETIKEGKEFRVRLKTTYEHRVELFNSPSMWQGKQLTVKYKRFTADGIPYLPIGKAIRDE